VSGAALGSYVELHLHSAYSFLEGASRPGELASAAKTLGYGAVAITDRNGLYGAMEMAQECKGLGLRLITGAELFLRHGLADRGSGPVPLTLLAESTQGYGNLCRLITEAHRASPDRDRIALDPERLAGRTKGLIALTGARHAEIPRLAETGRIALAADALDRLAALFGRESTFVELQRNLVHGDTPRVNRLVSLAAERGIETVATGDVLYHERSRHRLQDVMTAVRHHTTLEGSHRERRPNSEFFLRPPAEMAARFADHPRAVANTIAIALRCAAFDLADPSQLGYHFPDFERRESEHGRTADEALAAYCDSRFEERYPAAATDPAVLRGAREQLASELALIAKHGLGGFFLIYRDLQHLATAVAREVRGPKSVREEKGLPPGRGRGSSVSSIVCYLVGLSHIDPVKNRLFFKRFLNEDLRSVPDIDLDFAREIREKLILEVYARYGHDHAALVCSYATYHLRSAIRDLGKAIGLPAAAIDRLAKLSEGHGADTVREELRRLPEFQDTSSGPLWQHLVDLAAQIDGFPRHIGQHVGGMIISSRPLVESVPVQPAAMDGRFICQWDKDGCNDARFIKIDFLSLGMLSLVEEVIEQVWEHRGEKVDLGRIDYGEQAIYDAICAGDTVGLFQVESRAQIQMLPRTQPRNLDDLAVQVSIVRPGPIVGGAVNPYVRRREEKRRAEAAGRTYRAPADHPRIQRILDDTLGVILYQDQVLEVAIAIGCFTPGEADGFRRAMSRRRSAEAMEGFRAKFMAGAASHGDVPAAVASAIFDKLRAFSEFGFPKSHAYAFAALAYQSAWLRRHYPAEYYAGLFNNQPMGFYAPHVLVGDAKRHGVPVLRVSVNRSEALCSPHREGFVRLGLTTVQGLGLDLARDVVAERDARGPFRTLADFLRRTLVPRLYIERLIAVGAFGELGLARRELLWQLGLHMPGADALRPRRADVTAPRQMALDLPVEQDMVALGDMTEWERMVADYGTLGLSPSHHPLGLMRTDLPRDIRSAADLRRTPDGTRVRTAGLVVCRQRPGTAKGHVFLLIEDETGLTNVVVRPDLYEERRSVVRAEPYLLVEGPVQMSSGSLNLIAESITPLLEVPGAHLPKTAMRHMHAGAPHDPREKAALEMATPPSHNFH